MGALSAGAISAIVLVIGYALKRKSFCPRVVPWLWLIGGFGVAGLLGDLLVGAGRALSGASSAASVLFFGVAVPALIAIYLGVTLAIDMRPKGSPTKATPWMALLFPAMLAAAGGAFTQLHGAADLYAGGAADALSSFFETAVSGF